ncbi:MAG: aldehyde ferredoxin oxidoreductase family protein [Candidatus Bathyarchaeia archaeon]
MVELRLLNVNLTNQTYKSETIDEMTVRKFIGGAGVGAKILYERTRKGVHPLSPDNLLIIMTGPVTGTPFPLSGRHHIITKSPLTGAFGDANSGGNFGAMLRRTGHDGIIFSGASDKPVWMTIINGEPKLRDAAHLWGKGVHYTEEKIRHDLQAGSAGSILSIGPGGENLSPIAAVMNDEARAAGRTGVGAVMGSKKLKAIYVKPHVTPKVHDEQAFNKVLKEKLEKIKNDSIAQALGKYGTEVVTNPINEHGAYPTRNFQTGVLPTAEKLSGEHLAETYLTGTKGCWGCTIHCARLAKVPDPPYQTDYEGYEYEGVWALGACCGIDDLAPVGRAYDILNDVGLDVISYGVTVACAMELYEKGKIPKEKMHGMELKWGNPQAIIELAWRAGYRTGFGDDIALGSKLLAEKYGMPDLAIHVKGLELPAYDPRGLKGIGLGYATSNRGGCHLRAYTPTNEVFGVGFKVDPLTTEGKAQLVARMQNYYAASVDSLVTCKFLTFPFEPQDFVDLVNPLLGWDWSVDELLTTGERIYNLERLFCAREQAGTNDTLPKRLLKETMPEGPAKGHVVELETMLKEYYSIRGWRNGVPTEDKLRELDLEYPVPG